MTNAIVFPFSPASRARAKPVSAKLRIFPAEQNRWAFESNQATIESYYGCPDVACRPHHMSWWIGDNVGHHSGSVPMLASDPSLTYRPRQRPTH